MERAGPIDVLYEVPIAKRKERNCHVANVLHTLAGDANIHMAQSKECNAQSDRAGDGLLLLQSAHPLGSVINEIPQQLFRAAKISPASAIE